MAPPLSDLIFIILQYLYKYNMYECAQNLEQESKVYFNLESFTAMVKDGLWENVHKYLSSFTDPSHCYHSMTIFWKIGREKFLEALDQKDFVKALSVFEKDLKHLWLSTPECNEELLDLIRLENFRDNDNYAKYGDTKTMRAQLVVELVGMLKHHPIIKEKLFFPKIDNSRLETLLSQSENWQQLLFCHNALAIPAAPSTSYAYPIFESSSYSSQHQSVDTQLVLRSPYRDDQNQGAGPSFAPPLSGLNFNPFNFRRQ